MKKTLTIAALAVGFLAGATALSVFADGGSGTWTPPTVPPPGGNVAAPINTGSVAQQKAGTLGVNTLVTTNLTVATGTPIAVGSVLTAIDSAGDTAWQSSQSSGGAVPNGVISFVGAPGTLEQSWTVPAGVTRILVKCWGAGGGGKSESQDGASTGGGGGGGYAEKIIPVTPGSVASVFAGTPGAGGRSTSNQGTGSTFSITGNPVSAVSCTGGFGYDPSLGTDGEGGSDSTGDYTLNGQNGTNLDGAGGSSPFGGNGGTFAGVSNRLNGNDGMFPGGGGSASYSSGDNGGNGAGGLVLIYY